MQENNSEQYVSDNIILLTSYIHRIMRSVHYYKKNFKKCHQSISLLKKESVKLYFLSVSMVVMMKQNFGAKFSTAGER